MKALKFLLMVCFLVTTLASVTYATGILRIPRQAQDDILIPLTGVFVNVDIHDQVAITTVRDVFHISGDSVIAAVFHYRLPSSASVTGFGFWRGDQFVPYQLRPGEQGGSGGGAHDNTELERYLGDNPFNIRLDSLPAGDFAVQLQYVELLPYDFGVVNLNYPLALGSFLVGSIDTISITAVVHSQRQMTEIGCGGQDSARTHVWLDDQYTAHAELNLNQLQPLRDWQLDIRFNQEDIGGWLYTNRSDTTAGGYFMLVVEPGIVNPDEQVQKFFTFVVDRSGSMAGTKITQAKSAANECFNRLAQTDYFNIIDFAMDVRLLRQNMLSANAGNLTLARNYIALLSAAGSTNTYGALVTAVQQNMGEGTANQVVFITDGLPTAGVSTDAQTIINAVTNANQHNARIFCFGIGQDMNTPLLNGLALANRGQTFVINPNEARIDTIVSQFYRYIATPALVNPEITFGQGLETDSLAPPDLQDISAGHELFLFGRYENFGDFNVSLHGSMPQGDSTFDFGNMSFPERDNENQFIPRMWAKTMIDYWLDYMNAHGTNHDLIAKIIELSLRFGILTPYTEFQPPPNDSGNTAVEEPGFALATASVVETGIELSWSPVGVTGLVSYNVYRAEGIEGAFKKLNDVPLHTTHFLDTEMGPNSNARYLIEMIVDGKSLWSQIIETGALPNTITLSTPYPNPFNATTSLDFALPRAAQVRLAVYDTRGALVETLIDRFETAGNHSVSWNGAKASTGVYIARLESGEVKQSVKLVLTK